MENTHKIYGKNQIRLVGIYMYRHMYYINVTMTVQSVKYAIHQILYVRSYLLEDKYCKTPVKNNQTWMYHCTIISNYVDKTRKIICRIQQNCRLNAVSNQVISVLSRQSNFTTFRMQVTQHLVSTHTLEQSMKRVTYTSNQYAQIESCVSKQETIPRLELAAEFLATKVSRFLQKKLMCGPVEELYWTDKEVDPACISSEAKCYIFVANRIQKIQDLSSLVVVRQVKRQSLFVVWFKEPDQL